MALRLDSLAVWADDWAPGKLSARTLVSSGKVSLS